MKTRLLAIALSLITLAAACSDDGTSVFELGVGDCFNDDPGGGEQVSSVVTVPCSEPHDNEIYFTYTMTDAFYPGQDAALQDAVFRCLDEFDGFVGLSYQASDLDIFPITPTAQGWDEIGDRTVYCVLYAFDLSKLSGSMRGSAR